MLITSITTSKKTERIDGTARSMIFFTIYRVESIYITLTDSSGFFSLQIVILPSVFGFILSGGSYNWLADASVDT